ncbi:hypothetical protein PR202_ga10863 [Eleusine coracana subsp. coracana]|uniref:Uncharacterized protein n=1 Tax=Eleusine coracana subsp. coracana TaxID=191504 RepID=A0AAV5C7R3_ELECO|nr:hypothetical protein PR202_ga10863 [Eleusine coracana subsp. coracana]
MLQEFVDNVVAVTKESVKTFTYESLNNIASSVVDVPTANVGSEDPVPAEKKTVYRHSLNTDSRTCEDVITELGPSYLLPEADPPIWQANWKKKKKANRTSSIARGGVGDVGDELLGGGNVEVVLNLSSPAIEGVRCGKLALLSECSRADTLHSRGGLDLGGMEGGGGPGGHLLALVGGGEETPSLAALAAVAGPTVVARSGPPSGLPLGLWPCEIWVSNGVVGSPAFAAYDQGYDVFLGNLRGLVSREHIDKNISSYKYWGYSVNEHGTKDMPAIIEEIHRIKTSEFGRSQSLSGEETEEQNDKIKDLEAQMSPDNRTEDQPYKLCAVCHSLGGAVMLMYVVTSRIVQKPHRLSRLILLSPAGFHEDSNLVFSIVEKLMLFVGPVLAPLIPGLYIPTRFFRMLLNKLARDFHNYPALGGLVQTFMGYIVGGDSSNWVGVLGLPHYNMDDMPGVSFRVALHLAQIKRAKKFQMYDYGSAAANMEAYGMPEPLDLGAYYGLIDIPVDLVAGQRDRVISPLMVKKHYKLMRKAGVEVSYNEFEYAHLDFTFSHREELLSYVMSRLLLVSDSGKGRVKQTTVRLRKEKKVVSEIEGVCEIMECGGDGKEEPHDSMGHST